MYAPPAPPLAPAELSPTARKQNIAALVLGIASLVCTIAASLLPMVLFGSIFNSSIAEMATGAFIGTILSVAGIIFSIVGLVLVVMARAKKQPFILSTIALVLCLLGLFFSIGSLVTCSFFYAACSDCASASWY